MRKIALLTFHNALNYGAVLQCYALSDALAERGSEVTVIDYQSKKITSSNFPYFDSKQDFAFRMYKWLFQLKSGRLRYQKFHTFCKSNLKLTESRYTAHDMDTLSEKYDTWVVGSDQVWNTKLTADDKVYFLGFLNEKIVRYSYACSLGNVQWDELNKDEDIRHSLSLFPVISLRENILTSDRMVTIQENIDPVFLISKRKWERMAFRQEPAIVLYMVKYDKKLLKYVSEKCKQEKKKFIFIYSHFNMKELRVLADERKQGIYRQDTLSPEEFLGYLANAERVYTNSFHGTAFSIIFHKDFYSVCESMATDNRVMNLLNKFDLAIRRITCQNAFKENRGEIDWAAVDSKMIKYRSDSLLYLDKIVS